MTRKSISPLPNQTPFRRTTGRVLLAVCVVSPMFSVGCRSGKSGWNLFSRRAEPSAEMLAGTGPTVTYPPPPSTKAMPESIASIAGGTAPLTPSTPGTPTAPGMPPAGSNPYALAGNQSAPPAYAMPGSQPVPQTKATSSTPDYAAASANGYAAGGTPIASSPPPTSPPPTANRPSGYNLNPQPAAAGPANTPANSFAISDSPSPMPPQPSQPKSNSAFTLPPLNNLTPSRLASDPVVSPTSNVEPGGGFALPSGIVPVGIAAAESKPVGGKITDSGPGTAIASLDLPGAPNSKASDAGTGLSTPLPTPPGSGPTFQTASNSKPVVSNGATPGAKSNHASPVGYMPGSTGASTGYPSQSPIMR